MIASVRSALRRIQRDLAQFLDPEQIDAVCREVGYRFRRRILDPVTTIHLFLLQILHGNVAIARLHDFADRVFSEASYCNARSRLPLAVLQTLLRRVASAFRPATEQTGRWHGHRAFLADGSSFSMPDTPELQKQFGQPGCQRPGCGFPVAHLLALFHAGTGFLQQVLAAPLRTADMSQAPLLHPELQAGDVLVADRAFCSFVHFALLLRRGLHGVFRAHQKLTIDFQVGRTHNPPGCHRPQKGRPWSRWLERLGDTDQRVEWFKPKRRPAWLPAEEYAALPDSLVLRELRYQVARRGYRTQEVTLVTSLLDATAYPAEELAKLYGRRWQVELDLRHLKTTMKMDILHCHTVAGVMKELTMFALVYNLVRAVMHEAAQRQSVPIERISFADALG